MNKIFKTNLIIIFGFILFLPSFVLGQVNDLVVEFESEPLFNEASFFPGQSIVRWVKATNNSGQPQRIAAEAINYPNFPDSGAVPIDDLSRALLIIVREKAGSDLYGGSAGEKTLFNFYQAGEIYLSDVSTGATKEYEFEIIFPSEKEKEWQGKTTFFNVLIGFQGIGGKVPPGGGGGGTVLPPGLTIKNENAIYIGTTTTKITWSTSYKSTSRVIYDTQVGVFDLNNLPNYGYIFSTAELDTPASAYGVTYHEVWLSGLTPNTTYYYRCISHASPPTISLEYSFNTLESSEKLTETLTEIGSLRSESVKESSLNTFDSDIFQENKEGEISQNFVSTAPEGRGASEADYRQEQEFVPDESEQEEKTQTSLLAGLSLIIKNISWWIGLLAILIIYLLSRLLSRTLIKNRKKKKKKTNNN